MENTLTAPAPAPVAAAPKASAGDWIGGVLISLLLPVIGAIVGIVYVAKGGAKRQVGVMCLAISIVAGAVYFALTRS
jgi:hypothetical protein